MISPTRPSRVSRFIGGDGKADVNTRPHVHHAEAARRAGRGREEVIARLRPELDRVQGARLFLQPVAGPDGRPAVKPTQYQYTLRMPTSASSPSGRRKLVGELSKLPELEDVATRPAERGATS